MEPPRRFHLAVYHENTRERVLLLSLAFTVLVLFIMLALRPILHQTVMTYLSTLVLVFLLLLGSFTLLFTALDRGNYLTVDRESITFVIHRPNLSPLHLTILPNEISYVSSARPPVPPSLAMVDYDDLTNCLLLYPANSGGNIAIYLREPRRITWTRLKRLLVPKLQRRDHTFGKIMFAASPHEECLKEIESLLDMRD